MIRRKMKRTGVGWCLLKARHWTDYSYQKSPDARGATRTLKYISSISILDLLAVLTLLHT